MQSQYFPYGRIENKNEFEYNEHYFIMKGERDNSNPIDRIPPELEEVCNTVHCIRISNCKNLGQDRAGIASLFTSKYPNLGELQLRNCGIEHIPDNLHEILPRRNHRKFQLETLNLANNNLTLSSCLNILNFIIHRRTLPGEGRFSCSIGLGTQFPFQKTKNISITSKETNYFPDSKIVGLEPSLMEEFQLDYLSEKINDQYTTTMQTLGNRGLPREIANSVARSAAYSYGLGGKNKKSRRNKRKIYKKSQKNSK